MKAILFLITIFSLLIVTDLQAQHLYKRRIPLDHPAFNSSNYKHLNKAREAKQWHSGKIAKKVSYIVAEDANTSINDYKQVKRADKNEVRYLAIQTEKIDKELNPHLSSRNYKDQRSYSKKLDSRSIKKTKQEATNELATTDEAISFEEEY